MLTWSCWTGPVAARGAAALAAAALANVVTTTAASSPIVRMNCWRTNDSRPQAERWLVPPARRLIFGGSIAAVGPKRDRRTRDNEESQRTSDPGRSVVTQCTGTAVLSS